MTWLRERTFQDVYGYEKMVDGQREVRPSLTKEALIDRHSRVRCFFGSKKLGYRDRFRVANYRYQDHFDGKNTYYYFGHPTASSTLVMVDIDVQKSLKKGTTEGALAFAEHLKKMWPNLYFETSTGGKGIHGYLVLNKPDQDAKAVNGFLKKLQDWLRAEAEITNADIDLVEIKGTCPVITMKDGKVDSVKYGHFAKIPREGHRFAELAATTVLDIHESLPKNLGPVFKIVEPQQKRVTGSVSGKNISEEELAMILHFEQYYEAVGAKLRDSRYLVSANDFAIFCVLQRFFFKNMNADGTMPVRRVEAFWNELNADGVADRAFNHHRFKVIRDFLSNHKHIDWRDHRYQWAENGKKGIACKWRVTRHFYELLEVVGNEGGTSFVVIHDFMKGTGTHQIPTPYPIEAEKERQWWAWAFDRLENYSLAA